MPHHRAWPLVGVVVLAGLALAALAPWQHARAQSPLRVVSTFSIVGEIAQRVGGNLIEHRVLVGSNTDAHTYEPTPQDTSALSGASLVFQNGLGFEPWLDRLYDASRSQASRVELAAGIGMVAEDSDHGHMAGELDPHVWHDVQHVMHMTTVARDALMKADPANAAIYEANAGQYLAELQTLDDWVLQQVSGIPSDRRNLVTSHDTLGYFAHRYGFEIVGTALGSVSTEVADPSAGAIAALIAEIRAAGVPAIFAENVSNPRLMQQIAAAAGVQLVSDLYTDALGAPGTPTATYDGMMRHNVSRIVGALSTP